MYNKYPYSDLHELNLDWILKEMKDLQAAMDGLLEEAIRVTKEYAKEYIDSQLASIEDDFATLQHNVYVLSDKFDDLQDEVDAFVINFNGQIEALKQYVNDSLDAQALRMNLLIQQNNEYLISVMESYLSQIKVINYFTGEKVTIQDMFNYLAGLHLNDSIDYDTMAQRAKTYTELAGLNITYTNLALHGNTLYI